MLRPSRSIVSKPGVDLTSLGVGSSLMSERCYDSDAQFISTPNRADHLGRSPTNRVKRRVELSDLIEQSHERSEIERWAADGDPNFTESHESAFGMQFIPTPTGTLRGASKGSQIHGMNSVEGGSAQDQGKKMNYVRSAPSLSSANEDELSPTTNIPSGIDEETLETDWKNFLRASRHRYGLASSGSLPPPSPVLVVSKTRQPSHSSRSFTDPRSIHLSEMGISKQVAPQSISSGSLSFRPSTAGLARKNQNGTLTTSSQENMQMRQVSGASSPSRAGARGQATHTRNSSSFYSRHSSAPQVDSSEGQSLRQSEEKTANGKACVSGRIPNEYASSGDDIPPPDPRVLSRFREHCDSGSLPLRAKPRANGTNALGSPRKVSIGWMSGGRRVGYGYSIVEDTEGEHEQHQGERPLHPSQAPGRKAEVVVVDSDTANDSLQPRVEAVHPLETPASSTPSHDDHSEAFHSSVRVSEAASTPRPTNSAKPALDYPVPAFLRAVLGNHSNQGQGPTGSMANGKIAEKPRPRESSPMVQKERCEGVQNQEYNSNADTSFARRWARLSRSVNVQRSSREGRNPGHKGWTVGAPHPGKEQTATLLNLSDGAEDEYRDANNGSVDEEQTPKIQPDASWAGRWGLMFSRSRESRQVSNVHRQDPSQSSSSAYEDCDSSSLKRVTSLKSNPVEDGLEIPGSFEGSRWASRISRMF